MEHYNVVIMTPGYNMEARYVISLVHTIKELDALGISWAYSSTAFSDVAIAREQTVLGNTVRSFNKKFDEPLSGKCTYDKLFLIDSDIYWDINDFLTLYHSDQDLISGAYLQSDGETTTLLENVSGIDINTGMVAINKYSLWSKSGPFEVAGSGLGFMCIKRGVFESIARPWFNHESVEYQASDEVLNVDMFSEDISFIRKVKEAGFKVYADPSVKVGHVKKANIHWY
jgi:hypothetical protein